MKKRYLALLLIVLSLSLFCSCSKKDSSFDIQFIDVGQGDSALVQCDGHYMLIDGGDTNAGEKVYEVLKEHNVEKLDILAVSHLHKDHIGGLAKALTFPSKIGLVISNTDYSDSDSFKDFQNELSIKGNSIKVPSNGDKYKMGSADIEIIDTSSKENNDSMVLMITYGKNKFLFTGDIENSGQTRISEKYFNESDKETKIDLIKMPHHGSYEGSLYRFLRTFMPDYAIISVGENNQYGHPHKETLNLLNNKEWKPQVYRTDISGDIIIKSDGNELSVTTTK